VVVPVIPIISFKLGRKQFCGLVAIRYEQEFWNMS